MDRKYLMETVLVVMFLVIISMFVFGDDGEDGGAAEALTIEKFDFEEEKGLLKVGEEEIEVGKVGEKSDFTKNDIDVVEGNKLSFKKGGEIELGGTKFTITEGTKLTIEDGKVVEIDGDKVDVPKGMELDYNKEKESLKITGFSEAKEFTFKGKTIKLSGDEKTVATWNKQINKLFVEEEAEIGEDKVKNVIYDLDTGAYEKLGELPDSYVKWGGNKVSLRSEGAYFWRINNKQYFSGEIGLKLKDTISEFGLSGENELNIAEKEFISEEGSRIKYNNEEYRSQEDGSRFAWKTDETGKIQEIDSKGNWVYKNKQNDGYSLIGEKIKNVIVDEKRQYFVTDNKGDSVRRLTGTDIISTQKTDEKAYVWCYKPTDAEMAGKKGVYLETIAGKVEFTITGDNVEVEENAGGNKYQTFYLDEKGNLKTKIGYVTSDRLVSERKNMLASLKIEEMNDREFYVRSDEDEGKLGEGFFRLGEPEDKPEYVKVTSTKEEPASSGTSGTMNEKSKGGRDIWSAMVQAVADPEQTAVETTITLGAPKYKKGIQATGHLALSAASNPKGTFVTTPEGAVAYIKPGKGGIVYIERAGEYMGDLVGVISGKIDKDKIFGPIDPFHLPTKEGELADKIVGKYGGDREEMCSFIRRIEPGRDPKNDLRELKEILNGLDFVHVPKVENLIENSASLRPHKEQIKNILEGRIIGLGVEGETEEEQIQNLKDDFAIYAAGKLSEATTGTMFPTKGDSRGAQKVYFSTAEEARLGLLGLLEARKRLAKYGDVGKTVKSLEESGLSKKNVRYAWSNLKNIKEERDEFDRILEHYRKYYYG